MHEFEAASMHSCAAREIPPSSHAHRSPIVDPDPSPQSHTRMPVPLLDPSAASHRSRACHPRADSTTGHRFGSILYPPTLHRASKNPYAISTATRHRVAWIRNSRRFFSHPCATRRAPFATLAASGSWPKHARSHACRRATSHHSRSTRRWQSQAAPKHSDLLLRPADHGSKAFPANRNPPPHSPRCPHRPCP